LYRFRVIARFSSKVTNFNPPHLHLSPPYGVIPFEFRRELWCEKTRVMGLSCGVICVLLRLAVLIQYRSVTDTHTHTHTDGRTDRHTTTAYTALSKASRGKNGLHDMTMHLLEMVCHSQAGYNQPVYQIIVSMFTHYEDIKGNTQGRNYDGFGVYVSPKVIVNITIQ